MACSHSANDHPIHPLAIFVQLTTACNAECKSCPHPFTYGRKGEHAKGRMSEDTWRQLILQVARARYTGQIGLYLHHEPLLVKSLYAKIRNVNEQTEAFVVLSTNGALLIPENRKSLIEARPRQVHVNINTADPVQYEELMKGLDFNEVIRNTHQFIEESSGLINVEINCPVMDEVDTGMLREEFPRVQVNTEFWANSRGGLLPGVSAEGKGSRFKLESHCVQPTVNFNVLWDGSVIACCMDWGHETRRDFPSILEYDLFEIYQSAGMRRLQDEFSEGDYSRYRMCSRCAVELGFPAKKLRPVGAEELVQCSTGSEFR